MVASTADQPQDDNPRTRPERNWTVDDALSLVRPTLTRIAEFADLEADWDSYGAEPISPVARQEAQRWVEIIASLFGPRAGEHARPYSVAPLADGGVQLEWRGPGGAFELEVGPDGTLGYLFIEDQVDRRSFQEADQVSWSDVLRALILVLTP